MTRPDTGITFDASRPVRDKIIGLGRVEDLAFAPNEDRLALLAYERNSIALCDLEIETVDGRARVRVANAVEYSSSRLDEPHGIDFVDDSTVVVANRRGDVVILRVPSRDASADATLTAEDLPHGAAFDLLAEPSSLAVIDDADERIEVLVCNNLAHTVTSHELVREPRRVASNKVLLRKHLECPDGVAVDVDHQWIAVSNHDGHRVMLYERSRPLDEHSEPDAILLGTHTPHGLRFSPDGRHLFVVDADNPYLHVYARRGGRWCGVEQPVASVRVRDEEPFRRALQQHGRVNAGAKGLDVDRRGTVLATSSWNVPVAFFDVAAIREQIAQGPDDALRLALELRALGDQSMAARVEALEQSTSFRVTKPLRALKIAWVRRRRR